MWRATGSQLLDSRGHFRLSEETDHHFQQVWYLVLYLMVDFHPKALSRNRIVAACIGISVLGDIVIIAELWQMPRLNTCKFLSMKLKSQSSILEAFQLTSSFGMYIVCRIFYQKYPLVLIIMHSIVQKDKHVLSGAQGFGALAGEFLCTGWTESKNNATMAYVYEKMYGIHMIFFEL